ncbi:sulfate ABC transporter substrate-binding protein [Nocardia huaxiensis]|uniref:Sulfate ABC transporter substrate-binding protein n=1 Tax=Nocardia huaxiensis TaxID=2755382 RepID=A0A7D6VK78_9NOCA|nr:sulfate ABC transporter substrate-binding protein [Nocardia huaxiensis]QLY34877.1 sulfate ABC transporter substrate-binding protein [Nocardia huaxiensis]UFT00319.1 sulfate ABC transporter substrate-binding protein [Nocardia huaxiensis]
MSRNAKRFRRSIALALTAAAAAALTACSGGSSDVVGGKDSDNSAGSINLYAYAVPKPGFDLVVPEFNKSDSGKGVEVLASYGASGDQSRKVKDGAQADVVNFSVEPDITRLVDAGLVDADWNAGPAKGIPFGSVVAIVVRKGNPKGIKDWDDLLKPGVEVVTPNPFSSGSAKWNLLAPYAAKSDGGKNPQAGLDYLSKLISSDHVKVQPKSGREATDTFLQGVGDVLLSYENEAIFSERKGDAIEHFVPATTFKIENPVAVLKNAKNPEQAVAFRDFLYTPTAQLAWAQAGFRPVDPKVTAAFASDFPQPQTLWTIADLGGWKTVDKELFAQGTGSIAVIYDKATK